MIESLSARVRRAASGRRGLLAAVVLALVVATAITVWIVKSDDLPDDAAFRYEDQVVTKAELEDRLQVLEALYGVQRPEDPDESGEFNRDAAKSMVVSLLLAEEAASRDIIISDKEAQTELDKLIDEQLTGGRAAFVDYLSQNGLAERDVLDEIRAQIATSRLVAEVTEDVPDATEREARRTYDEHRAEMVTPEGRDLINIVVETRTDAERVLRLAKQQAKLAPLARTWSLDGSTRESRGRLGVVTAQQLEKGYAAEAFAADEGEIFGPVQTASGWNVGQVLDVISAKPLSYDAVAQEVRERLTAEDKLDTWREFLTDALAAADVEYAGAYRPVDPAAPPTTETDLSTEDPTTEPATPE